MLRLAKYLKPYLGWILAAVLLLYGQASSDLALPDYMSRIVNVGIQQGGVESPLPELLRASTMERLLLFMGEGEAAAVSRAYVLAEPGGARSAELAPRWPEAARLPVYALGELEAAERAKLEASMARALLAVAAVEKAAADPAASAAASGAMGGAAAGTAGGPMGGPMGGGLGGFDLSRLPPGADLFALLGSMLPAPRRLELAAAVASRLEAIGPGALGQAATRVVHEEYLALGADAFALQRDYMLKTGGFMLLLALAGAVATVLVGWISARVAAGVARDLRAAVFSKVEGFSLREFDSFSTASLITRSTNDVTQLQGLLVMLIRMVFYAPIIGVGGVFRAMEKGSGMWWVIALAVGLVMGLVAAVFAVAVPRFTLMQKLVDRLNLVAREVLTGMPVVRAFGREAREEERFDEANRALSGNMRFISRVMVVMMPLMMLVMNGVSLLILWIGSKQVAAASMQVGDMMAFMQYAMQIFFAFLMMSMMFIMIPRAQVSASRVAEVLETEASVRDPAAPKAPAPGAPATVEFREVSFAYPGAEEEVLRGVSFTARPGRTTAIIGATGAGKTSLVALVPRFYDVTAGAVIVGGVDVREQSQAALRELVGYVPQKASLFSGTIESNLRYAREEASPEELEAAARVAQAGAIIAESPEGMGRPVSQGGSNLSGGQKQRLSIARALVKKPPILILDDSFSALDFRTDAALRRALKAETEGCTVLLVTQRVATAKAADEILVLDEGKVAGFGSHAELMAGCGTYREIAGSQLSEEELR